MLRSVSGELSIVQVTPYRRTTRNAVNEFVERVSEELERRGHRVRVAGVGDQVKRLVRDTPADIVHVHEPFAPRVSSTALRHSTALNVATFHAPQERVLSTQVARPLVEIFFGRLDARTVTSPQTGELLERYFPADYELLEPGGPDRDWATVAAELEAIYLRLAARRHDPTGNPAVRERIAKRPLIEVDLHMHTDHSPDCATPVEVLLETARDRGLGAIAITDHNEVSGALEARRIAEGMDDLKVIVAEEVKTAEQGEVIGLFLEEKIPQGDDDGGDDRRDPRAGRAGLRAASVRPLPLGARLRAPARHGRGDRRARGLQPPGGRDRLQRGGRTLRPQVPDRPRGPAPTATSPRASAASACGSTTSTVPRSSSRRCGTPTSPASTRTSSTCRR